jgi:Fe-S cluster biogenesis protein NfuA
VTEADAPRVHVERTDDDAVLRWVCAHPALVAVGVARCRPPGTSPLGELLVRGAITRITTESGDVLVRVPDARDWDVLAPLVHDAVVAELRDGARALVDHVSRSDPEPPSMTAVQALVDRSVGALASAHGGRIEVRAVGPASVALGLHGGCSGCPAEHTTRETVAAAIRQRFPQLRDVTVDDGDAGCAATSPRLRIPFVRHAKTRTARPARHRGARHVRHGRRCC